jgi:hypothetical protein
MTQIENELLNSPAVDKLVVLVEEATRSTVEASRRFIEPARGTLDRAKSRRHHLIFGRRGSGKTSLLRKAGADLSLTRTPSAFIDLEAFKGHQYPDVLLSILIETLNAFDQWLATAGINPSNKKSFWMRWFGSAPNSPPLDRRKVNELRQEVQVQVEALSHLLHAQDGAELTAKELSSNKSASGASFNAGGSARSGMASLNAGGSMTASETSEAGFELTEAKKRDKIQVLLRRIIDFQKLFERIVAISGGDAFIFLDDLYHIRRTDQAPVLDYFHRIAKGRSVWIKAGTIRHRTEWYHHGDPPVGLKIGDDCDDIDLDVTLEKYEIAKAFLLRVLDQLVIEAGLTSHSDLLADGGTERLVLASGGVARDFLTIFRRSIDVARERGKTYRGNRINAEDVNVAAGEHDPAKRDELKRDTLEERAELERALLAIQTFCLENKVNCFLVERDTESRGHDILGELVDLRFVHVVESRTTVRDLPGKLFTAYLLDISQYTGERRRRELEMISFWKRAELDKIRRSKFVLDVERLIQDLVPAPGT